MKTTLLVFAGIIASLFSTFAQTTDSPVAHMEYLNEREIQLSKSYLGYISEVAHGERAKKMEKRRGELITSIKEAIRDGGRLRPYKGDVSLRNAFIEYWNVLLSVFNEDYHKIVDMEEVAEQSYDLMEAYLLAQERVSQRLEEAFAKVSLAYTEFAKNHNVTLAEGQTSKLSKKLDKAGKVNKYSNMVFLVFFKASYYEGLMLKALRENDVNGAEQNRNNLKRVGEEGLQTLDTLKPFQGDGSLMNNCRKAMEFFISEATKDIPSQIEYLEKKDSFDKIKKDFDSKPASKRTQQDVAIFNEAVAAMNKSVDGYNKTSTDLNNRRTKVYTNWNNARKKFMDTHVPRT